jgi:hypothetical protein
MRTRLEQFGIPEQIRAFFNIQVPVFDYGDSFEHYGDGFHKIPATQNLWLDGNRTAREVIITFSAMEAVAFLTMNRQRYPNYEQLAFIAIGSRFSPRQADWIRSNYRKRKFTLVFGKELIGNMTDIKMAAGLKGIQLRLHHTGDKTIVQHIAGIKIFEDEQLSLHAWELAFGMRTGIRTRKPLKDINFLEELKHDTDR